MKKCCKFHDDIDGMEMDCGMAGMGDVILCCPNCPEKKWYEKNQPTRGIEYRNDPHFFDHGYDKEEFLNAEDDL